jgi:hypothetical protein
MFDYDNEYGLNVDSWVAAQEQYNNDLWWEEDVFLYVVNGQLTD